MGKTKLSEKEKCQAGLLYDANYNQGLAEERNRCKDQCWLFNSCRPSEQEKRMDIMKGILGKTGSSFLIEQTFWCDYGYNIEIGENFYANHGCVILDAAQGHFWRQCLHRAQLRILYSRTPVQPGSAQPGSGVRKADKHW